MGILEVIALAKNGFTRLTWILILESTLTGAYASLTSGLFGVFLASVGHGVEGISIILFASVVASIPIGVLLHNHPSFIKSKVKLKLTAFHGIESSVWLLIPLAKDAVTISALYSVYRVFSFLASIFLTFVIYGSLAEDELRTVSSKRSALAGISVVLGFGLGTVLLTILQAKDKFVYVFSLGALMGLISTLLLSSLDLSSLERVRFPQVTTQPEKVFSASLFLLALLASGNLLGILWTPYVMLYLHGSDSLAALMALVGTFSSITGSLAWGRKPFKTLWIGLALNTVGPILICATPWPILHVPIRAYTSFTFTAANILGTFLFAKYNEWFGAVKSSVLLVTLANSAQLIAASLGIVVKENYIIAFSVLFAANFAITALAALAVSEVAVVSEDTARTYSRLLYSGSLLGYRMVVEYSKETVVATLRLLACSLVIMTLYVIYRILWILLY